MRPRRFVLAGVASRRLNAGLAGPEHQLALARGY
jgi:hypothetical protein